MTLDYIGELGFLTLGTRLKRLGERLQAQVGAYAGNIGIDLPAAMMPLLAALDALGPMTVGELAAALGVSQPGVTRSVGQLETAGLVAVSRRDGDARLRDVALTQEGRALVATMKETLWPSVEAAVADACAGLNGNLLGQLQALEEALAATSVAQRAECLETGDHDHE